MSPDAQRRRRAKKRQRKKQRRAEAPRAAYTIPEFCEAHRISRATYYNVKKAGRGPREKHVLGRIIITGEAAADWRSEGTAAASNHQATA